MIKLPENIENEMKLYRSGESWRVPFSYIAFHCELANKDMYKQDWKILEDHGLVYGGWCDGVKFKRLVVAYKESNEYKIGTVMWHESGAWFMKSKISGGWFRFREMVNQ